MRKEFADYIFRRLSEGALIECINALPLKAEDRDILLKCYVDYKGKRGWQKQAAYDENVEANTISKRYNKALGYSSNFLISYIARSLEGPKA